MFSISALHQQSSKLHLFLHGNFTNTINKNRFLHGLDCLKLLFSAESSPNCSNNVLISSRDAAIISLFGKISNTINLHIIWTTSMLRLYFLIERCYKLREPVLLVGETGGGKTTVCQSLSIAMGSKLHILNCHQHTETSDFLGGFYPLRDRSRLAEEFKYLVEQLKLSKVFVHFPGDAIVSSNIESASSTIDSLNIIINNYTKSILPHLNVTNKEIDDFEHAVRDLMHLQQKWQAIFEWQDGPLVQAMKNGDMFLIDEISLADDSVLERLNSILEPEKKLTLAEKGGPVLEEITAHPNFFLLATMNPGGDYGKKELSPALRNRFTEIWVPPVSNLSELRSIAVARLQNSELSCIVDSMLNFWEWFNQLQTGRLLTVRILGKRSEREQLCRLMDCQKLSLEACTHAAQNERLPLRVVVQVLFFEQLQLRTSIAGCFLVSENLDVSRPLRSGVAASTEGGGWVSAVRENQVLKVGMDNMRMRVSELEKECSSMRQEIEKLGRERSTWGSVSKKFGLKFKSQMCSAQEGSVSDQNCGNGKAEKAEKLKDRHGKQNKILSGDG